MKQNVGKNLNRRKLDELSVPEVPEVPRLQYRVCWKATPRCRFGRMYPSAGVILRQNQHPALVVKTPLPPAPPSAPKLSCCPCVRVCNRFNVYLLVLCVLLFSYTYYIRRGRALVMAIGEATRCRQVRLRLSKPSSTPPLEFQAVEEPGSPGSDYAPLSPPPSKAMGGALLPVDGAMPKHLLFAPPGTTPAGEFPPRSYADSTEHNNARQQRGSSGSVISINAGGPSSFQGALTTMKTGGKGFGRNILRRSLSTPERTAGSIFSKAVATSPSAMARGYEGVPDLEEGVSSPHTRASKEAGEATVLRGASEAGGCGGEDGLSTQQYGSVEEKSFSAKTHKWKGPSHIARLRKRLGVDDQAYGAISEEEDDELDEGGGSEWRKRVSKWYGSR